MTKTIFTLFYILLISQSFFAQDPTFSQTTAPNINLNTALIGNDTKARLSTSYRNQWAGMSGNIKTSMINFYQYIPKSNGYGGINFMFDNQANVFYTRSTSLFYSQNIKLGNFLIRPSVEGVFVNKYLNWNHLVFNDSSDPVIGELQQSKPNNYLDLNIGTVIYYKKLLLGLSAHNINQPNTGFFSTSHLPTNYGLQLCYTLEFNKFSISPFAYYNYQNSFQLFVPGVRFMYNNHFNFAFSTRTKDAVIFNFGYQNKVFVINYSYDYTISKLNNSITRGSHELSLSFKFWNVKAHEKFVEVKSVY